MQSSLISKIAKAQRYAEEPERVQMTSFQANFHGENGDHVVAFDAAGWTCTCDFYAGWGECCHTMAVRKLLHAIDPRKADPLLRKVYPEMAGAS